MLVNMIKVFRCDLSVISPFFDKLARKHEMISWLIYLKTYPILCRNIDFFTIYSIINL
jgi:hypothetical protein